MFMIIMMSNNEEMEINFLKVAKSVVVLSKSADD